MINETLKSIQQELKAPKGQRNNFGNYNYRSCEDILEAVKPLLAKHNATLTISDDIVLLGERYYVKATATLRVEEETISTTGFAREEQDKKGMDQSQITGASSSYARKYALNGLFAIDDTKDSDATNTCGKDNPAPKTEPKVAPKVEPKVEPKTEQRTSLNGKPDGMTLEQLQEFNDYGYELAQLVAKLNKPSNQITYEEMENVLIKIRAKKGE